MGFDTLRTAIETAGIAEELAEAPFTILAPSDEAFALANVTGTEAGLADTLHHVLEGVDPFSELGIGDRGLGEPNQVNRLLSTMGDREPPKKRDSLDAHDRRYARSDLR